MHYLNTTLMTKSMEPCHGMLLSWSWKLLGCAHREQNQGKGKNVPQLP